MSMRTCVTINFQLANKFIDTYPTSLLTPIRAYIHTYIHTYIHACMHACMYRKSGNVRG